MASGLGLKARVEYHWLVGAACFSIASVRSGAAGNLYVHVVVETPVNLNSEQKELLRKFQESLGEHHSPQEGGWQQKLKNFFSS